MAVMPERTLILDGTPYQLLGRIGTAFTASTVLVAEAGRDTNAVSREHYGSKKISVCLNECFVLFVFTLIGRWLRKKLNQIFCA